MKITKVARQNSILLGLSLSFLALATLGINNISIEGYMSLGVLPLMFGGIGFLGFTTALLVRLWEMD